MATANHLLAMLPTRPLQEVLLRALGGIITPGMDNDQLLVAIQDQMTSVDLLGFHLFRTPDAYTLTLLTGYALLRVEVFPNGDYMIRVVPLTRLRQVSERRGISDDGSRIIAEIVIEFDAGVTETVTEADMQLHRPGGWVLMPERTPDGLIPPAASDQMLLFAAQIRHLLASRPL